MSILSQIERITNEVGSQQELIAQIVEALEGKAGGSGGVGFSMGRFTPSTTEKADYTIQHDLGVTPDVVVIYDTGRYVTTQGAAYITIGTKTTYGDEFPIHLAHQHGTAQTTFLADGKKYDILEDSVSRIVTVTENTIILKGANHGYLIAGRTYSWFAIAGVIE